jgi:hypothetical protein
MDTLISDCPQKQIFLIMMSIFMKSKRKKLKLERIKNKRVKKEKEQKILRKRTN